MLRKSLILTLAALLLPVLVPAEANAWGGYHVGYQAGGLPYRGSYGASSLSYQSGGLPYAGSYGASSVSYQSGGLPYSGYQATPAYSGGSGYGYQYGY
jgi:hypothetical protein